MIRRFLLKQLNKAGLELVKINKPKNWPVDFEEWHKEVIGIAEPYTMTGRERMFGLAEGIKYIETCSIDGAIVECGVWKGGSMLLIAQALQKFNSDKRDLFLYDTYEGMPPPGKSDISYTDESAESLLNNETNKEKSLLWAYSSLETVKRTMSLSNYPPEHIHYIKGKVENTIPATLPEKIALLRLDTDWYESTKHELIHLYPRIVPGGILIIDDYGFWKGARKAVDEYFFENKIQILLNRMDDTGRIGIKQK